MSFSPEIVAAVMRHMNDDHADDCAIICRALGGPPDTTSAVMSGMDSAAAYFDATVGDSVVPVRVPFSQTLIERAQVRVEITQLYYTACERLGLPARTSEQGH
jgi:putative heme iron utilization protein